MPVMIIILMLIMKLVAVVVMTLSTVMIATDISDNYFNILCLLISELHNILHVSCCVCMFVVVNYLKKSFNY
jgi:hypothetical protein